MLNTLKKIEEYQFVSDKIIMHPQQYRDIYWGEKLWIWWEKTTWLERFVAWLFSFETIRYEDFSDRIEANIEKIRKRQSVDKESRVFRRTFTPKQIRRK